MPETKVKVELPDGAELELDDGATGADAAAAIGPGLAKAALAIKADGELRDLGAPLAGGERIEIVTDKSPEALELVRHDAAHVLAEAVLDLWPAAKISIGPPIADGFYYDIEFPDGESPGPDDLARIEERMREHIAADEPFEMRELPAADAIEHFRAQGQDYKVELIEDLVRDEGAESVTLYRNGPFEDLCRGPHGPSTGRIGAFKLTSLAGAYWRGDETRQMLTRIYGTAFHDQKQLDAHLEQLELAKQRDHRRLGPELDLFMLRPEAPGMPFWLPNGSALLELMAAEVREQLRKRGYEEIKTPEVLDEELWHRSGHWDNYKENMFFIESEGRRFALKPMNCPGACVVFGSRRHSYRELPLRLAEFGKVFRNEREGVLHGLLRVRAFTQDDAHVYCTEEQVTAEVVDIIEAIDELYARFGFEDPALELSTRPEKSIGTAEQWERAESALKKALDSTGRDYKLNPGEGAFYGPKIDFHVTDALGPLVAARHLPARLLHARALRPLLYRRRQRRTPPGDDPPRAAGLDGALRGDPDRAPRRAAAAVAGARAGPGAAGRRPPQRVRRTGGRRAAPGGRAGRRGRAHRIRRTQDPRRRAGQGAVHAGARGPRAGVRQARRALPRRRRTGRDDPGRAR